MQQNNKPEFENFEYKLIYRSTRDGLNEDIAKNRYENKPNILCFIEDTKGNVLDGYTKTGWKSQDEFSPDLHSFIFGIRSSKGYTPIISNIKKIW